MPCINNTISVKVHVDKSHTADNLRDFLFNIVDLWNIRNKITAVVTDNGANIVKAVGPDGCNWRRVPCFAHTLSLAVKGAIEKNVDIKLILDRCRAIVTFFHHSTPATLKLSELCVNLTKKVLQQEGSTRWNSTLIMVRSLMELRVPVIDTLKILDRQDLLFEDFDWETLAGVIEVLTPFEETTTDLSSQYYPSISKVIPSIKILQRRLADVITTEYNPWLINLIGDLRTNVAERFISAERETSYLITTFLDPRL